MPANARHTLRPLELPGLLPVDVARALRHLPRLVFFDSALEAPGLGEVSIVAAAPEKLLCGSLEHDRGALEEALGKHRLIGAPDSGLPLGFAAGCVEYEGLYDLGFYEHALFYRHQAGEWWALGDLDQELRGTPAGCCSPVHFQPALTGQSFFEMVRRAQEYIRAGDIYQVNLSHRFRGTVEGDVFAFYERLRSFSPAPYAAFLDLGERQVLSSSPESFLHLSGRQARTRPIKGTRPRKTGRDADEKSAYDLLTSPKEQAELLMITDLLRNDLGALSEWGSVEVRELLALERYEQVFHLVSTVESTLRAEVSHAAALGSCFPGGSITGAPKRRAREIIAELEGEQRGIYTGALGWLGFNEESQWNIAIRTVVCERGEAHFRVGAGIVADSVPEAEWQETLDKAAGILQAAAAPAFASEPADT